MDREAIAPVPPVDVPTAQQRYKGLLKTAVGPSLRRLGFKGRDGRYRLGADGGSQVVVMMERHRRSDDQQVRFTASIGVVSVISLDDYRAWTPWFEGPAQPYEGAGAAWFCRVGQLLPPTYEDHWWVVAADQDPAADVTEALVNYAVPFAVQMLDEQRLAASWLRWSAPGRYLPQLHLAPLLQKLGQTHELAELTEALIQTQGEHTIALQSRERGRALRATLNP